MTTDSDRTAVIIGASSGRRFFVSSPATAARQIMRAVRKRAKHAYITRRYALVAFIVKLLPRAG
jgi:short-subunit dehydrogenase